MTDPRQRPPECIDPETLAAFIDGRLDAPVRGRVEGHLAVCEDCYEAFSETVRLGGDAAIAAAAPATGPGQPGRSRLSQWLYAAAGLAAGVGLAVWAGQRWFTTDARVRASVQTVMAAVTERPLEARVTGDRTWRPVASARRGTDRASEPSPEVRIATARIDQALASEHTVTTLSAFAKSRLFAGRPQEAAEALEEAIALGPPSADLWSDLAVAYLARANDAERSADLPRALDAVERALALGPGRPEIWFNKALILERLGLIPEAIDTWERYLKLDDASDWAPEARLRLERLRSKPPKSGDAQPLRERLFDVVLPAWARATIDGRLADAAAALVEARKATAAIAVLTTDRHAHDVLVATEQSASAGDLHRGLVAFGQGRQLFTADNFEAAIVSFDEAERRLIRARHPLALSATVYRAQVAYRRKNYDSAHAILESIRPEAVRGNYPSLVGKIDSTRGLMLLLSGRVRDSAASYASAIDALDRAGEPETRAFVVGLMATNYDRLGDPVRRWQARLEAVRGSTRETALLRAADEARSSDWPHAARDFAEAALARANRPATRVDALRWLATMEANLGNAAVSERLLTEARKQLQDKNGVAWDRLRAEVELASALSAARKPSADAVESATRALTYFQSVVPPAEHRLPQIFLARARLNRALGRPGEARTDLTEGIAALARMRSFVTPGVDQATLSDAARQLADELVDFVAPIDEEAAFIEVEKLRAWDLSATRQANVPTLRGICAALPPTVVVADYVVGEEASYVWVLRRGNSSLVRIAAGRRALSGLVAAARHSPAGAATDRLSDLLLGPIRGLARPGDLIAVIPDGPLHLLPFASLRGFSRPYLVEEHALLSAPSMSVLLAPAGATPGGLRNVLTIGNPAFDRTVWPDLPDLPAAAHEASMVAANFRGSVGLSGAGATRAAVLARLPGSDAIHVAAHGIVNEFAASESALVLAGPDVLTAGEIRSLQLRHVRLVVLASCDSARGYLPRSEGPLGLARSFLAAGAGAVVASLSSVSDGGGEDLFREFYAKARETGDFARALQAAQLAAWSAPHSARSRPSDWGQFVLTGSLASGASSFASIKE